jgi:uncharacterized protein (TIGR03066 family)
MSRRRWVFAPLFVLIAFSSAQGQAKTDPKAPGNSEKIVGLWDLVKGEGAPPGTIVEFTKDLKIHLTITVDGAKANVDGKYKVDGDKITLTAIQNGKEDTEINTIKSLTAERLVLVGPKGKEIEFKKRLPEKKK